MIKFEARNPKSETNSKLEFLNVQNARFAGFDNWDIGNLSLFRISILGFRILQTNGVNKNV